MIKKDVEKQIMNKALNYLNNYFPSSKKLKLILIKYSKKYFSNLNSQTLEEIIENCVKKCIQLKYINDTKYIEMNLLKGRKKGLSRNQILSKLYNSGVSFNLANQIIEKNEIKSFSGYTFEELAACIIWIKKKKLGPFGNDPEKYFFKKNLALLARAGFSKDISKKVLNIETEKEAYKILNNCYNSFET